MTFVSGTELETEQHITVVETSSPSLSQMLFSERAVISFRAGVADQEYSGISERDIATAGSTVQNKVYALGSNNQWGLADANGTLASARNLLALALGTEPVSDGMMLQGFVGMEGHGFTIGAPIYLSNTAGTLTDTVPGSGYARIAGYAVTDDSIYFDPDKTWVEIS